MQLFTFMDHLNGACSTNEIGTPWKPRWSKPDYELGLCGADQVGTDKPAPVDPTNPDDQPPPPPTAEQLALDNLEPEFIYERELADYHADRAGYRRAAGANLGKLMAIGEEIKAKRQAQRHTAIDDAFNGFDKLHTSTANRLIFDWLLEFVPEDHPRRQAALEALAGLPVQE